MAQETINLIQEYYQAFNDNDLNAFYNLLDDEVIHDINQGIQEIGREKFKRFMEHMHKCYKEKVTNLFIMTDKTGKHGGAKFLVEGVYLKTDADYPPAKNQKYVLEAGAFFEIQAGKIKRVTSYYNLPDWIKQITT